MSPNFKIESYKNDGNICIDMIGDFDGNSACKLVNTLILEYNGKGMIIINTEKLEKVLLFGIVVFKYLMAGGPIPMNKMVFKGAKDLLLGASYSLQPYVAA